MSVNTPPSLRASLRNPDQNNLLYLIQQKIIQSNGSISFADFMQQALYAPGLGYYVAGQAKLGAQGDFVTAPEISPLFSRCLANQCAEVLSQIKDGSILELGAGTGKMAIDILESLEEKNCLPEQYFILELSPDLRERQSEAIQKNLPHLQNRVEWLSTLPQNFKGVILANEVMDAFPVHCFRWSGESFMERGVGFDQEPSTCMWKESAIEKDSALDKALQQLPIANFSKNYQSEINLFLSAWIKSLSESLQQGLILLIDYGFSREEYYHPERSAGTLMCHYQHKAHGDPFVNIGEQDLTTHVDFTAVLEAAQEYHLQGAGYVNQANFLLNCDLLTEFETQIKSAKEFEKIQLQQALRRLMEPHEMGELFKCIALTRGIQGALMGFKKGDRL